MLQVIFVEKIKKHVLFNNVFPIVVLFMTMWKKAAEQAGHR